MTNQELSKKILELVGGQSNVISAFNCMTRLRINIKDKSQVKLDALKAVDGVLGVVEDNTLQVVLGPGKAKKVCDLFVKDAGVTSAASSDWKENKESIKSSQGQSKVKEALRTIADIFIPMLPAIIAAGLFNGFASLIGQMAPAQIAAKEGFIFILQTVFSLIGGGFLSYFAIYTGINAAKKFGATPALGGMLGAMSIMPQINTISTALGLFNAEVPLESILTTGKGGIIGVIFGVWILSKVENSIRKRVPDVLDLIVTPFVSLIIVAVIFVLIIMPITGYLSDWLVGALSLLINSTNPVVSVISGFVLSALFLPMVLLGLHHGLIPIYAIQLEQMGGVSLFPVLAMAGAGQVGAAIAIYMKAKKCGNIRLKKVIAGALPAGFLGVGEPLIYGVTLPMGKPFITAGIGAGFGGAFVMIMKVVATSWGPSGLVAIPLMKTGAMMMYFLIGLVISYVAGFIITALFIKEKDVENA
ncbi:PTS transporter subunit EIIC [Clostridium cadaveris]|uniref:PTS glucose transporter subunit IIB n=1 Tax=Clostridium cadaveris TaxID=1529 RepID=A0A316M0N1_9CLOT|nr:PTS transporter subunit EIIC [Clostridium cadaveris]NWK12100.1 PTS transporter subunit EIIC [Clostridium cadaveris]PWL52097.1 MAG: PTS glucose transporter subunit IIB [Clostridium cadaveris]UFH65042.1 PTS transporter subunit EIIC [Clostridium cadaveris]